MVVESRPTLVIMPNPLLLPSKRYRAEDTTRWDPSIRTSSVARSGRSDAKGLHGVGSNQAVDTETFLLLKVFHSKLRFAAEDPIRRPRRVSGACQELLHTLYRSSPITKAENARCRRLAIGPNAGTVMETTTAAVWTKRLRPKYFGVFSARKGVGGPDWV